MLQLVPFCLLLNHLVVSCPPQFAELVELLNLGVLTLDVTVLAQTKLLTLLGLFNGAITATTPCAVMTVVLAGDKPVELSEAELTIGLVLHWLDALARGLVNCCDQGRV